MEAKEFKEEYERLEFMQDAINLLKRLTPQEKKELLEIMQKFNNYFGVTMRDEYFIKNLEASIKYES